MSPTLLMHQKALVPLSCMALYHTSLPPHYDVGAPVGPAAYITQYQILQACFKGLDQVPA